MYIVFYKDENEGETEHRFRIVMDNDPKDIFVKNSLNVMGWNKDNIQAYEITDKILINKFKSFRDDSSKKHKIWVDEETKKIQRINITKEAKKIITNINFESSIANDYYTQDQINDWTHNNLILQEWLTTNDDGNGNLIENPEPSEPNYEGVEWPDEVVDKIIIEAEEYEILEEISGTLVNIDERIALEEQALADGLKKLP
jgi:hypothetical protein